MKTPFISIITATYNRAHTLPELKRSIEAQTFTDFEWIVIDDGSTDDTRTLLREWENEPQLNLVHVYQENGGKHRALNKGIGLAKGYWVFVVDSDDRIPPDALATIRNVSSEIEDADNIAGLIGLKADFKGKIIGEALPENVRVADALTLTYKYGIRGDKAEVFKTDILRRFSFPEFEGEKFLTEAVVWYRIARAGFGLYLVNTVLYEAQYHAEGLSSRSLKLRTTNIFGTLLFYKEEIEKGGLPIGGILRESANYVRFMLHAKTQGKAIAAVANLPLSARLWVCCAFIPGWIAWLVDTISLKRIAAQQYGQVAAVSATLPVKVLHVINSLAPGGAERLLAELLPRLQSQGVQNYVLALDGSNAVFAESLIHSGIPVFFACQKPKQHNASNPYNPVHIFSVLRMIRRIEPHIVHSHLAPSFHWCATASLVAKRPIYVTTEHASQNNRMLLPFFRGIETFSYSRYQAILCVSKAVAAALKGWLHIVSSKIIIVPNGVDPEKFGLHIEPAVDVLERLQGRKGIAMTARFVPIKDHATALRTLSLLPQQYALVLVGDGPDRQAVEDEARKLGVFDRCLFLGSRNDVPQVLRACQLYLQTSKKEGFGIAALEAMASGLPVVASDVSGLSELVKGAGLLFPQGDAKAAAQAVLKLGYPEEQQKAIQNGLEKVQQYSLHRSAKNYSKCYHDLLKNSGNKWRVNGKYKKQTARNFV